MICTKPKGLISVFLLVTSIFRIGQSENHVVESLRTFQRRQADAGGNVDVGFSLGGGGGAHGDINVGGGGEFLGGLLLGGGSRGGGDIGGEIGGGVTVDTNSLSQLINVPLQFIDTLSGVGSRLTTGILGAISSPVTLSGDAFDAFGLVYSPIVGPVSGTLFAGVQALVDSPETIQTSLSGGLQEVIQGITGALTSPFDIIDAALNGDIVGILSSPLEIVPALSGNLGITASGILEALASPLTISAQFADAGVQSTLNSIGGVVPTPLQLALPHSISRGIQDLIDSPASLADELNDAFGVILAGIMGILSSPLKISGAILQGDLNLHYDSLLVFPKESDTSPLPVFAEFFMTPIHLMHALCAQLGITVSGILGAVSSPLSVSGEIIDNSLNVDAASPNMFPEESIIGQPQSFSKGIDAVVQSPIPLSSTVSDSVHVLIDGFVGLLTSPITVLCGYSPIPFPGSANNGIGAILDSPMDLYDVLPKNIDLALTGIVGFLASPVTLSAELLRSSVNFNVESLNVLPEQLELWGVPNSIASTVTSFLEVPFDGFMNILGLLESPLALLDRIAVVNVPGSPNAAPLFPPDFPNEMPDPDPPAVNHRQPCLPSLSGSISD